MNARILLSLSVVLCLLLPACTTKSHTQTTVQDSSGKTIYSSTSSSSSNKAAETVQTVGTAVKEGVVSGYEWTKDKTVKGYNWVKEKAAANSASSEKNSEKDAAPQQ